MTAAGEIYVFLVLAIFSCLFTIPSFNTNDNAQSEKYLQPPANLPQMVIRKAKRSGAEHQNPAL